jgi:hypothetical protein
MDTTLILIIAVIVISVVIAIFIARPFVNKFESVLIYLPGGKNKSINTIFAFFAVIIAAILFAILFALNLIKL